jgi:hypothetical protein
MIWPQVACLAMWRRANSVKTHEHRPRQSGGAVVRAAISDDHVRIEVEDNRGTWDEHPHRDSRAHGLDIVRELAADCGRDGSPLTGWVAWARLEWRST